MSITPQVSAALPRTRRSLVARMTPLTRRRLANFRAKYGVATAVPIYGPYDGHLNNSGESINLYKPDPPQIPPHPDVGFVPYVLVESITYSNALPWPSGAGPKGIACSRAGTT